MEKLYVIVRKDLSPSQRTVQAAHAVAEYMKQNPDTEWPNGTLVVLASKGLDHLKHWVWRLAARGVRYTEWREPDIGDELTAIAIYGQREQFKSLQLI